MLMINSLEYSSPFSNMLLASPIYERQELNSVLVEMKTTSSYFIVVICLANFIVKIFLCSV